MNIFQEQDSICKVNTLIFGGGFIRNNLNFDNNKDVAKYISDVLKIREKLETNI